MPTATVRHESEWNSTHRGAFKKGYILTVKVETVSYTHLTLPTKA